MVIEETPEVKTDKLLHNVVVEISKQFDLLINMLKEMLKSLQFTSNQKLSLQCQELLDEVERSRVLSNDYQMRKRKLLEGMQSVNNNADCLRYSMFMVQNLLNNTRDYNVAINS
jgi:hypothetical protein